VIIQYNIIVRHIYIQTFLDMCISTVRCVILVKSLRYIISDCN